MLLFSVLGLVLTMPLPLHLANAVEDRQDALLNVWITAWDGHQLLSDPVHLFDANIFHPYRRTLAYSELLLGNGLLALPVTAASGNPVLGYNAALLLSFVLTGLGTYLLVLKLTRSPAAGAVAGSIFAFCSFRMTNLAQAQLLTTQWMPLTLLSLHQVMRRPRPVPVATLVLFFCLQALSSFYYGILLAIAVLVVGLGYWIAGSWPTRPRLSLRLIRPGVRFQALLLAAGCSLFILLPFLWPYVRVQRELGFERTLAEAEPFSASLRQYAMVPPGSVLYGGWLPTTGTPIAGGYPVDALFPGFAALALALWGLIRGRRQLRWFFFCLLVTAILLSLGPRLYLAPGQPATLNVPLPYAWLYAVVPGFRALRAPVRFDALVMLSMAVLAGYGAATLIGRRRSALFAAVCLLLVLLEQAVWPAARTERVPVGSAIPPVYRWLAAQPRRPILELPMAFALGGPQLDYQYLSTAHWQPTPDGYSGFIPPKHGQIAYEMERFPSERSVSLLQALGVQYVVIHSTRYPADRWAEMQEQMEHTPDLVLAETFGADRVYRLAPRSFEPDGLEVRSYLPSRAAAGQPYTAYLIMVNRGGRSYAIRPTDKIRATGAWQTAEESTTCRASADVPLVTSPDGGAAVVPLTLVAPERPGSYRLALAEQDGPLGTWKAEGEVTVGSPGEQGAEPFPVPAQLLTWTVPETARPGQPLRVGLTWRALGKIDAYYSVYVKVLDAAGQALTGWDGQPRNGEAPTLEWVPGETIADTVILVVPADAAPGDYAIEAGMYRAEDLARALTLTDDGIPVDRLTLGVVRISP